MSGSGSVASTSVTAVWFSAGETVALEPPPSEVIEGDWFAVTTVTGMVLLGAESLPAASRAVT